MRSSVKFRPTIISASFRSSGLAFGCISETGAAAVRTSWNTTAHAYIVVNANMIPDPSDGNPEHHWEIGFRLITRSRLSG